MNGSKQECVIAGCPRLHHARGLCNPHYQLWRLYGDPAVRQLHKPGVRHGMSHSPEYYVWHNMIRRCSNPMAKKYSYYGGRGIKVCDAWRNFSQFYRDMGPRPGDDWTIDRIDPNGNYSPNNCRWADRTTQALNVRRRSDNTSGYRGVSWSKERKLWEVSVAIYGRSYHVGRFSSRDEAAWMSDQWRLALHGDEARLNFKYENVAV